MAHPSLLGPRPAQTRRRSLDALPVSRFESTLPYHTGLNTARPPQTPAKLSTSRPPANNLPIVGTGDFPRINNSLLPKYAGPTFHNSPHAASLPKPDMEDF